MIAIYEDQGGDLDPEEFEPTALYDGEEWIAGGDEWEDYYPEGTPEDAISSQLDGPSVVAVEVTEGSDEILDAIQKDKVGPPQAETMGVGDDVEVVEEDEEVAE